MSMGLARARGHRDLQARERSLGFIPFVLESHQRF